jgi:hypothetical protein
MTAPLKFVFDLTSQKQREEIANVFFGAATDRAEYQNGVEQWFRPTGISYESRRSVVQLLAADMLAWTSATIRARDVFRRGEFVEAYQVGLIFTSTEHIRIGYRSKEALQKWEHDILGQKNGVDPLPIVDR